MASRKTPAAKKPATKKPVVAKKSAAPAVTVKTAVTKIVARPTALTAATGKDPAACANLAALRDALAAEKGTAGAKERARIIRNLEALETDYRDFDRKI